MLLIMSLWIVMLWIWMKCDRLCVMISVILLLWCMVIVCVIGDDWLLSGVSVWFSVWLW